MTALSESQQIVYTFTLEQLWSGILALAAAITAIAGAVTVVVKVVKSLREPDKKQNARLEEHDKKFETLNRKLSVDEEALALYRTEIISLKEHQKEQDILLEEHSRKVASTEQRLDKNDRDLATIMRSLLALLDFSADNTAIGSIQEARTALQNYLINN